jgi:hypothetical protein
VWAREIAKGMEERRAMVDVFTKKPLRVVNAEPGPGSIYLPADQLEEVQRLFDSRGVHYWVSEGLLSMNDGPYEALIVLERRQDPRVVQTILDSVP